MRARERRKRLWSMLFPAVAGVLVLIWTLYGFMHISPFAATWDEVDFALALTRFDLLTMQPHFPGYPYFVLGAMGLSRFMPEPIQAYGAWNLLLTASSCVPLWLLTRRILSCFWSAIVGCLVLTSPCLWLQTVRPMSEAAGIVLLWWFLWCWWRAMEHPGWRRSIIALFGFGLLMGVRLSFAPFGLAVVWLLVNHCAIWRKEGKRLLPRLLLFGLAAALFQLLWVAGLAMSEGGLAGFVKLAAAFTAGHFSEWGGGVAATGEYSFAGRLLHFAGGNLLWTGMFARSNSLLAAAAALLLAAVLCAGSRPPAQRAGDGPRREALARAAAWLRRPPLPAALAVLALAYAAWALLAQNIDKPRHITPLIGVMWLLLLALFRAAAPKPAPAPGRPAAPRAEPPAETRQSGGRVMDTPACPPQPGSAGLPQPGGFADRAPVSFSPRTVPDSGARKQAASSALAAQIGHALRAAGGVLAASIIVLQTVQGSTLLKRQSEEQPAVYQLAAALDGMQSHPGTKNRAVVYTWEESRVLDYLHTGVSHRQILTYSYFLADVKANPEAEILLTDHVLSGFEAQAGPLRDKVRLAASFHSEALFDPVYHDIQLYEWIR